MNTALWLDLCTAVNQLQIVETWAYSNQNNLSIMVSVLDSWGRPDNTQSHVDIVIHNASTWLPDSSSPLQATLETNCWYLF